MSAGVMSRVEESPPLVKGRPLLLTMLVLQLLCLGAIVVTGTSSNRRAILLLAVYSAVVGLAIILAPRPVITKLWRSLRIWLYDNKNPMIVLESSRCSPERSTRSSRACGGTRSAL